MASFLKIGAAWWQYDKNQNPYLSITIGAPVDVILHPDQRLHLYANPNKQEGDRLPDYELVALPMQERETRETPAPPPPPRPSAPPRESAPTRAPNRRGAPITASDLEDPELEDPFAEDAAPAPRAPQGVRR